MKRIKGQNLIVTRGVIERLDSLRISLYVKYKGVQRGARLMGMTRVYLYNLMRGERTPSLDVYLKLAKVFDWDLSRDVNYAYATVLYPPEEIKRRLFRIYPEIKVMDVLYKELSGIIGYSKDMISATINYKPRRSAVCYDRLMMLIAVQEKLRGYSDALEFEE